MQRTTPSLSRIFSALLLSMFLLGLTDGSAQSLGDLARQERLRVRNNSSKSTRVFTNEDLARPKILDSTEREDSGAQPPVALAPAPPATPPVSATEQEAKTVPVPVWPEGTPLGDVARYYRQLRELRSAPLADEALEQDAPAMERPSPTTPAPRQQVRVASPAQPIQKPRPIAAIAPPAVRENSAAPHVVRVMAGDSLWKIARRHLGDGNQWTEIAAVNPEILDPNQIRVGRQIRLPGGTEAVSAAADKAPSQVRVQAGDSLWKLAKAHWGVGSAWGCIAQSNPQIEDSSKIYPGQTLTLPEFCSPSI